MAANVAVRDLRRMWKPHKERLNVVDAEHPTNVRFHRACSWLQRAEQATKDDADLSLLCRWIAFNALYGQWDHGNREAVADTECWKVFLERMVELDRSGRIADVVRRNRPLVMAIFDDEFLSRYYWQEPNGKRAGQSKRTMFDARTWFVQGKWLPIVDRLVDRIYFLRCQLVHGAATYNGSLNRTAIRNCSQALDLLLRAFLVTWIDHGSDEDWGILCYPPLRSTAAARSPPPGSTTR